MKHLLIVDDEALILEWLSTQLDWSLNGLVLHTATSVRQAVALMECQQIHILLSDIEMPQEDGFALLEWTRAHRPNVIMAFVTCHDEFAYVQRAMRLGAIDYLLKPIQIEQLTTVIASAIQKVDLQQNRDTATHQQIIWQQNHGNIRRAFFSKVLSSITDPATIAADAAKQELVLLPGRKYSLVYLLRLPPDTYPQPPKAAPPLDIRSLGSIEHVMTVYTETNACLFLCEDLSEKELQRFCWRLIDTYRNADSQLGCYRSNLCAIDELLQAYQQVKQLHKDNVALFDCVLVLGDPAWDVAGGTPADFSEWKAMLLATQWTLVEQRMISYLNQQAAQKALNREVTMRFYQNVAALLYSVLDEKGIKAHQFIATITQEDTSVQDFYALYRLKDKLHTLLRATFSYTTLMQKPQSLAERVADYIREHIEEDLTCIAISEHFFFHPDYLTRLLKQETGQSLLDLYSRIRMEVACKLLAQRETPITLVAQSAGYRNISHFSRMFRLVYGITPSEYRKKLLEP
ncbi:MAG: response regulator [Clostridiales bacterium]|nr:response regulator [Clostridiales bacterium]